MEVRFALHSPIMKSQLDLLNAVRRSEIHTYGWPIGVMLENKEEYRPRPISDGIRAEVAIEKSRMTGATLASASFFYLEVYCVSFVLAQVFDKFRVRHQSELEGYGFPRF